MKKTAMFAAGLLFGTAGLKLLTSKDAKKLYAYTTAAILRAKDSIMQTVTSVRENAGDIYAEAKTINADRAAKEAECVIEDTSDAETENTAEEEADGQQ